MQQYYTLEEAAQKLGMSVDELREMAKKKQIRAFQDRGNWRFRAQEIDERARQLGVNSDPEVQLSDAAGKTPRPGKKPSESDAVDLGKRGPKRGSDSDVRLVLDEPGTKADSDVRLSSPTPKRGGDSGVRLDQESDSDVKLVGDDKPASDSDIRLEDLPPPAKKKGDPGVITEEIDLDAEEAKLKQDQPKARPGKPKGSTQYNPDLPILPTSSPYELSEPDLDLEPRKQQPGKGPKGTQDSSSEHELIAFDEAKARGGDLGSGDIPLLSDDDSDAIGLGDLPPAGAGNSGINLDSPADSGISLEGSGDELEFELSLDSGNTPKPQKAAPQPSAQEDSSSEFELSLDDAPSDNSDSEFELSLDEDTGSGASDINLEKVDNSDSEFELTLDEEGDLSVGEGGKDIFEETNFDLPPLDGESQSEAVPLEETSDTDLEGSDFDLSMEDESGESGSQVVALEDEEADDAAATVAKPKKGAAAKAPTKTKAKPKPEPEVEEEPEPSLDDAMADWDPKAKTAPRAKKDDDDEDERDTGPPPPADWGPLPAVLLFPTVIVLFFVGLMGFELVQGMWGYHRSTKVSRPIIDTIARVIDDKIPKE